MVTPCFSGSSSRNAAGLRFNCGFLNSSRTTRDPAFPAPTTNTWPSSATFLRVKSSSDRNLGKNRSPPTNSKETNQSITGRERAKKLSTPINHNRNIRLPTSNEAVVTATVIVTSSRTLAYTQKPWYRPNRRYTTGLTTNAMPNITSKVIP